MSKTKKILSIVLAVVMAFSVFSICAFADTDTATWTIEVTNTDGTPLGATIPTGNKVLVTVKLQTNFYVGTVGLPVVFSDAFEYVDGTVNQVEIYGAGATRTAFNDDFNAGISGTKAVYAVYVPNSGAAGVASPIYSTATTVLSFQLEAVSEATADIYLPADMQKTDTNLGGRFYCGSRATSDVTTDENMTGQTFVTTGATATVVISNAAADPILTGKDGGVVYTGTDNYVYGIPVGADANDYFEIQNGTFTVSATATGATLTVYTTGGAEYATYTVVIFGDVDGDGIISMDDYILTKAAFQGSALTGAALIAADINGASIDGTHTIDMDDYIAIKAAFQGSSITVNPYI